MSNQNGSLEELNQRIIDNDLRELNRAIREISADIQASIAVAKLPEIVFKDYFLDNFKLIAAGGEVDNAVTLSWIDIAGGPYAEVDVVDNAGNVLFRVPGLMARPTVDHSRLKGTSFNTIAAKYQAEANRLQVQGDRYLHGALSGIDQAVGANGPDDPASRWKAIFDRYADKSLVATTKTKKKDELENNLEFEYDE